MKNKEKQEMLPWYINGSLSMKERAQVERSFESSEELNKELNFLKSIRQHVKGEVPNSPGEMGLQRLRREIKQEPKSASITKWRAFSIAASLVVVVQLGLIANLTRTSDLYIPLSDNSYPGNTIQIQFKSTATAGDINSLLLELGGVIIDGPSALGIYRIKLKTVDDVMLQRINQHKDIVDFVAEE